MKILVTGGCGFVGCSIVPLLLENGYQIKILDLLLFGEEPIESFKDDVEIIKEDIRNFNPSIFDDIDTVIHLAALSQPDELKQIPQNLFYEINLNGSTRVAEYCKKAGVERLIFASTCSVYGYQKEVIYETTEPKPLEAYGDSKLKAEKELLKLSDKDFCVTIMRPATMYGLSPKMRFDLVVNGMTYALYSTKEVNVMKPGTQWRPNIHVRDVGQAIRKIMEADKELVDKEIFNIGSNDQNYQIQTLAEELATTVLGEYNPKWYGQPDTRSYKVNFDKLRDTLGFKPNYTVSDAAKEITKALESGQIEKTDKTINLNWYKLLVETKQI
ncbi:MAG: NAD-dependent epimerase/dehydratase family protein [Promethearchaeota archaeon]